MDEVRCPFRVKAHDAPDTCDSRCAWLMQYEDRRACALAIIARNVSGSIWRPANQGRAE